MYFNNALLIILYSIEISYVSKTGESPLFLNKDYIIAALDLD